MRELATLTLDSGAEVRVELDREDLASDEILVRRAGAAGAASVEDLLRVLEDHLATAEPHGAGTTDRLLESDRLRAS